MSFVAIPLPEENTSFEDDRTHIKYFMLTMLSLSHLVFAKSAYYQYTDTKVIHV
jgi:hypothetical protein